MGKRLTARNIAEEFGETSRHWTKLATAGLVPGVVRAKDKAAMLFDLDVFRAWHEAGQPELPKPAIVRKPEPPVRPDPEAKRRAKRAEIDAEIASLVKGALSGR